MKYDLFAKILFLGRFAPFSRYCMKYTLSPKFNEQGFKTANLFIIRESVRAPLRGHELSEQPCAINLNKIELRRI